MRARLICLAVLFLGSTAMGDKAALTAAKNAKKDEFYTQRVDIENELNHYKAHFKNKVVLCNCDDPRESEFFKYFVENFEKLGLKRLIATCYKSQDVDLFSQGDCERAIYQIYEGDTNGNMTLDDNEVSIRYLNGDGDFRSAECIEILKQADIVVTNPPFSLFREYVAQLVKYDKKFLIIGHQNAITYKEIFAFFKDNKIWLGFGFRGNAAHFRSRYKDVATAADHREGMIRVSGVMWFTNLDVKKRHEKMPLYKKYSPDEFPHYENYDAINIDKTSDIPFDYDGVMGVPITFMDKYNPEQFEIVALGIVGSCEFANERRMEILDKEGKPTGKITINAKGTLYRKHLPTDKKPAAFRDCETGELYQSIYARILIRRKGVAQ